MIVHLREFVHDLAQQRDALLLHLHADRNVFRGRVLPERVGLRIGEPGGLIRNGAAGGEQPHAGAAAAEPVSNILPRPAPSRRSRYTPVKRDGTAFTASAT